MLKIHRETERFLFCTCFINVNTWGAGLGLFTSTTVYSNLLRELSRSKMKIFKQFFFSFDSEFHQEFDGGVYFRVGTEFLARKK